MKTRIAVCLSLLVLSSHAIAQQACTASPPIIQGTVDHWRTAGILTATINAPTLGGALSVWAGQANQAFSGRSYTPLPATACLGTVNRLGDSTCIANDPGGVANCVCPYLYTTEEGKRVTGSVGIIADTACQEGFLPTGPRLQCKSRIVEFEDIRAGRQGLFLRRDALGNVLQVVDVSTSTVRGQLGGYDALGRPGWYDDGARVTLTWPDASATLPSAMTAAGTTVHFTRWAGLKPDLVTINSASYDWFYYENDSLGNFKARSPTSSWSTTWNRVGKFLVHIGHGPPVVASVPTVWGMTEAPETAPAIPDADARPNTAAGIVFAPPGPHVYHQGVHPITQTPAGSLFVLSTIAVGTTLLSPTSGLVLDRVTAWLRNCFASTPVSEELEKKCEDSLDREQQECTAAAALYGGSRWSKEKQRFMDACSSSAMERYIKCRQGVPEEDWPPLHGANFPF